MQHDKVQVQLITLPDMFWTPVPTHTLCFWEVRGRAARAEKLWAVPPRAVCKPASGAWRETVRGRLCCEPKPGKGEWEQNLGLYSTLLIVHRTDYSIFCGRGEICFL